jgi:hypothetical protein
MTQDNRIPKVVADFAHSQDEQDVLSFLSFRDWFAAQETQNDGWTVVASSWENEQADRKSSFFTFSALLSMNDGCLEKLLSTHEWDVTTEDFGQPNEIVFQKQFNDMEFQAFIIYRQFHTYIPKAFELVQEFLLYHNAFYVADKNEYHCITNDGNSLSIVRIKRENNNQEISVDTEYLRRYLAETQCYLVRYYNHCRKIQRDISELISSHPQGNKNSNEYHVSLPLKSDKGAFELLLRTRTDLSSKQYKTSSQLFGKDIIFPYQTTDKSCDEEKKYAEFIVGRNENGKEIEATCHQDKTLSDPAKHFFTLTFFRKTVLSKYLQEPSRYYVNEKRELDCLNIWKLPFDQVEGFLQVYLGDLAILPYSEQLHWKQFNVAPRGTITKERFLCDFMAIPTNPSDDPIHDFRTTFEKLQKLSKEKYNESLFKHLDDGDQHLYQTLHIPLTEEQKEFDELVIALAKIVTDSLNVSLLSSKTGKKISQDKDSKIRGPIDLLGVYLEKIQVDESEREQILLAFRAVQTIRSSGAAHSKNPKEFGKALQRFDLENLPNSKKFKKLIVDITQSLQHLNTLVSSK